MNYFLIGLWRVTKSGVYMTTGYDQLSSWAKLQSTSQSQTCSKKKVMVTVWWSAACLNPGETITSEMNAQQIDEKHREAQRLQLAPVKRKGPVLHNNAWPHVAQARLQKLNELGCEVLSHLPYSPDFLKSNYLFFKHLDNFLQEKCFHNQEEAENASQEFVESQSIDFYATGINKLISHWQKCVDCNGSYFFLMVSMFINKDCVWA